MPEESLREAMNLENKQQAREYLLEVISTYQTRYQALQGLGTKIVNPFGSLDRVVKKYVNPLFLFLADMIKEIEKGNISYLESLERIVIFAAGHKYRDAMIKAAEELTKIEGEKPYFLNALSFLAAFPDSSTRAEKLKEYHKKLHLINNKYIKKYETGDFLDIIPWRIKFVDPIDDYTAGTYERPTSSQLDVFRDAILALGNILIRNPQLFKWYHARSRKEIEKDIVNVAEILFDYGYQVEKICSRRSSDNHFLADLLNRHILRDLQRKNKKLNAPQVISRNLFRMTLIDFKRVLPDHRRYCKISNYGEIISLAREIRRKGGSSSSLLIIARLYRKYRKKKSAILSQFLNYRYSKAFYDYHPSALLSLAADYTKKFVFSYFNPIEVEEKAKDEIEGYSSKGKDEMIAILKLLMDSLMNPGKMRGKLFHVLGKIQSGAMGQVNIGIYQGNIVALKEPVAKGNKGVSHDLFKYLEYEARIHSELGNHKNIVECFGIVKDSGKKMLALGYYPADNLGELIKKNFTATFADGEEGIALGTIKKIFEQIIDTLLYLKKKQVIHRDLKPQNILYVVDLEGKLSLIKIIDFGISLSKNPEYPPDPFEKSVVGTLNFMAPEQLIGQKDYKIDIYSSGVILYQLLTGKVPLALRKIKDTRKKLVTVYRGKRIPITKANSNLENNPYLKRLGRIIESMLIINPMERAGVEKLSKKCAEFWKILPEDYLSQKITYHVPKFTEDNVGTQRASHDTTNIDFI